MARRMAGASQPLAASPLVLGALEAELAGAGAVAEALGGAGATQQGAATSAMNDRARIFTASDDRAGSRRCANRQKISFSADPSRDRAPGHLRRPAPPLSRCCAAK